MPRIPIEDAIEILAESDYYFPSYPSGIMIEVPEEFTPEELYFIVEDIISGTYETPTEVDTYEAPLVKRKELWEMTYNEFVDYYRKEMKKKSNPYHALAGILPPRVLYNEIVVKAYNEGKPVPENVLKRYEVIPEKRGTKWVLKFATPKSDGIEYYGHWLGGSTPLNEEEIKYFDTYDEAVELAKKRGWIVREESWDGDWRHKKAEEMINYYRKRMDRLKGLDEDWAKSEIEELEYRIMEYFKDYPELAEKYGNTHS